VFIEDAYRGKADIVLASGPSASAKVEGSTKVIRLAEKPWEEWLFPKFVEAARKLGAPGYDKMAADAKRLDSDTGELSLDWGRGLLTINTPRTKSAIGLLDAAGAIDLGGLHIDCETGFAAITATSLDVQPIGRSRRVLLTSVARAENTKQGYGPPQAQPRPGAMAWALMAEGRPPALAEPVRAQVRLTVPGAATVYALDPTGKRVRRLNAKTEAGILNINPAEAGSIWCEVAVD
jgi:hypothetical protein